MPATSLAQGAFDHLRLTLHVGHPSATPDWVIVADVDEPGEVSDDALRRVIAEAIAEHAAGPTAEYSFDSRRSTTEWGFDASALDVVLYLSQTLAAAASGRLVDQVVESVLALLRIERGLEKDWEQGSERARDLALKEIKHCFHLGDDSTLELVAESRDQDSREWVFEFSGLESVYGAVVKTRGRGIVVIKVETRKHED